MSKELDDKKVKETIICEETVETKETDIFEFSYGKENVRGIYAFQMEALSENSQFFGGAYCSNILYSTYANARWN